MGEVLMIITLQEGENDKKVLIQIQKILKTVSENRKNCQTLKFLKETPAPIIPVQNHKTVQNLKIQIIMILTMKIIIRERLLQSLTQKVENTLVILVIKFLV